MHAPTVSGFKSSSLYNALKDQDDHSIVTGYEVDLFFIFYNQVLERASFFSPRLAP
jgi:hypothetical protein